MVTATATTEESPWADRGTRNDANIKVRTERNKGKTRPNKALDLKSSKKFNTYIRFFQSGYDILQQLVTVEQHSPDILSASLIP